MNTSIDSQLDCMAPPVLAWPPLMENLVSPDLPAPHPAEPDTFARHAGIPGHHQVALQSADIVMVGAGGTE